MRRFMHILAIIACVVGIINALPAVLVIAGGCFLIGLLFPNREKKGKTEKREEPKKSHRRRKKDYDLDESEDDSNYLHISSNEPQTICPKCGKVFDVNKGKMRKIEVRRIGGKLLGTPVYEPRLVCPNCSGWF